MQWRVTLASLEEYRQYIATIPWTKLVDWTYIERVQSVFLKSAFTAFASCFFLIRIHAIKIEKEIYISRPTSAAILTDEMKWKYEGIEDHRTYTHNLSSCELKLEKNSGLNGIPTHNLCDTGAVRYQRATCIKPIESWSHCEFVIYP